METTYMNPEQTYTESYGGYQKIDALKSLNRLKLFGSLDNLDQLKIVGPLTLDSKNLRVYIIPHTEMQFAPDAYETLYTLAMRENKSLTFEQIYDSIWETENGRDRKQEARDTLTSIVEKINSAGAGFAWIEESPSMGYTFKTKWGHNREAWQ